MRIGIDFDNTIVCYDAVFDRVAVEMGWLEPVDKPRSKVLVRDTLRARGMEEQWINLQGRVYGASMHYAVPYPGVIKFLEICQAQGVSVCIVSHKTRYPFRGPQYDLHKAAWAWLEHEGLVEGLVSSQDAIFFELTKQAKLDRISKQGISFFIDDLPEFLSDPSWPAAVAPILFDPDDLHRGKVSFLRLNSWNAAPPLLRLRPT